jgi:tRNA-specific 2-thiouridylase
VQAQRLGLAVAEKPDSQDICFVPEGQYHQVVAKLRPEAAEPGEIVDATGRVLGQHQGIARYTIGQGRGLGLALREGEQPLYVAALDAPRRRVVVAHKAALPSAEIVAGEVNWLWTPPEGQFACEVKLRAREQPQPCLAEWDAAAGLLRVRPAVPAIAAPGQGCVLYAGNRVLGGGFIRRAVDLAAAAA